MLRGVNLDTDTETETETETETDTETDTDSIWKAAHAEAPTSRNAKNSLRSVHLPLRSSLIISLAVGVSTLRCLLGIVDLTYANAYRYTALNMARSSSRRRRPPSFAESSSGVEQLQPNDSSSSAGLK